MIIKTYLTDGDRLYLFNVLFVTISLFFVQFFNLAWMNAYCGMKKLKLLAKLDDLGDRSVLCACAYGTDHVVGFKRFQQIVSVTVVCRIVIMCMCIENQRYCSLSILINVILDLFGLA